MAHTELPVPLYTGFFPQMVLTVDELMHYRRVGNERVAQLMRMIDDAECIYRWTDVKARNTRSVQKAQFSDIHLSSKQLAPQQPSTIFKSSVHLVDVQAEEILQALAKRKTRDARRVSSYLYKDDVIDTQTLLTFPTSSEYKKPSYSYRAIKWCLLKSTQKAAQKRVDVCYLEYAGKRKARTEANSVVGFFVQESIARDRKVPTLERYGILRGQFVRTGILITKTHQSNILKVTAMAQVDGALEPKAVKIAMERIMVNYVAAVHRVKGLLERQRMGKLQYLDQWDWVPVKERKTCAVCLRTFFFHRKYHCASCGEVVCSKCAPLRELEEPLNGRPQALRVCSICMAQAGSHRGTSLFSGAIESKDDILKNTTCTTNVGTESYINGLRYPRHRGLSKDESLHPLVSPSTPEPSFCHHVVSSRSSVYYNEHDVASESSVQYQRTPSKSVRREGSSRMLTEANNETLVVEHVRQIRDTINVAISEADLERQRQSIMPRSGRTDDVNAEKVYERYDCCMNYRDTLEISSSGILKTLDLISGRTFMRSGNTPSDRSNGDFAQRYTVERNRFALHSPRSSLLSASDRSLDHQDAGEDLLSPRLIDENPVGDARALDEAIQWTSQPKLIDCLPSTGTPSAALIPADVSAKHRGIERLARKIGRLNQRCEASQRKSDLKPESQVSPDPVQKLRDANLSPLSKDQGPRAPPDLVATLRGVMNSSELMHMPQRRRVLASPPPTLPAKVTSSSRQIKHSPPPQCPGMAQTLPAIISLATLASPALTPEQNIPINVCESQDQFQQCGPNRSLLQETEAADAGLDEVSS